MINFEMNNLIDFVKFIESFHIYINGKRCVISTGDNGFDEIKSRIEFLFGLARVMPAFGVSLHSETLDALKQDCWIQINFIQNIDIDGLNFDGLLFK